MLLILFKLTDVGPRPSLNKRLPMYSVLTPNYCRARATPMFWEERPQIIVTYFGFFLLFFWLHGRCAHLSCSCYRETLPEKFSSAVNNSLPFLFLAISVNWTVVTELATRCVATQLVCTDLGALYSHAFQFSITPPPPDTSSRLHSFDEQQMGRMCCPVYIRQVKRKQKGCTKKSLVSDRSQMA